MLPARLSLLLALLCAPASLPAPYRQRQRPPVPQPSHTVRFSSDRLILLPSPDDQWTLANGCHGCPAGRVLWLANNVDHHRRIVRKYENTIAGAWSSDSANFFVNDEPESGAVRAYVIEAASLKVTEIEKLIVAADDAAPKLLRAHRAALAVERWRGPDELLVALTGRVEEPTPTAFEVRYDVKLSGAVRRVSERTWEPEPDPPSH